MIYSVIALVAIVINLIVNRDVLHPMGKDRETEARKAYRLFNYGILAYHATDVLWGICDASGSQWLLYADTVLYYIAMYLAVMLWAKYAVTYLDSRGPFRHTLLLVTNLLMLLEFLVLFFNHFVHFFFWVDEAGDYHAYTFRYLALAVQILLFLLTSAYAFRQQKSEKDSSVRNRYRTIAAFGLAMTLAILVQVFYPLLPFYSIGYMIGICLIHSFIIEDENAELRRKADEANAAKTSFLFNMSHDIRTPMNAILGYTDIGLRHAGDLKTVKDSFGKIKTSGSHLLRLINDILEMSRIESGSLELADAPMDLRETVDSVKNMSETLALTKSIDFSVLTGEMSDPYVFSDELHINEVLINLTSNAIKYTPPGGKVRFRTEQISGAQDGKAFYRFEIADTGIGMSEEFQTHLFENFSREKTATVSKTEGTGLGLSIVKHIVDLAGGTISVRSATGQGSTFTVEMPLAVMNQEAIDKFLEKKVKDEAPAGNATLKGKRLLLVEDNEMNREIALDLLTEAGFEVETAADGQLAVEAVASKKPGYFDIILMDIQMPVMNGYEATRIIRTLRGGKSVPIIALSANAFAEDRAASMAAGMNDHIAKPINNSELFGTISRHLQAEPM